MPGIGDGTIDFEEFKVLAEKNFSSEFTDRQLLDAFRGILKVQDTNKEKDVQIIPIGWQCSTRAEAEVSVYRKYVTF